MSIIYNIPYIYNGIKMVYNGIEGYIKRYNRYVIGI